MKTTWRDQIILECERHGDTFPHTVMLGPRRSYEEDADAVYSLDHQFDSGYGDPEGCSFTAWSDSRVYFPICYDGAEWCGSAPRNPCDTALEHQGGG